MKRGSVNENGDENGLREESFQIVKSFSSPFSFTEKYNKTTKL